MPAHPHRRAGFRRDALLPFDRGQARPPPVRRPDRTHQRKRLDPGPRLNSYSARPRIPTDRMAAHRPTAGRRGNPVPPAIARRQWDGAEPPSATVVLLEDRAMPATHVLAPPRPLLSSAADGTSASESTSRPPSDPGGTQDTAARTSAATFSSTSGVH